VPQISWHDAGRVSAAALTSCPHNLT
jgi:hypothetical protein